MSNVPPDLDTSGIDTRRTCNNVNEFLNAIRNARPGHEIILKNKDDSYTVSSGDTSFSIQGTSTKPIIIRAEDVGRVTLSGSKGWNFSRCHHVTWYGFKHRHSAGGAIVFTGGEHNRFARCDVQLSGNNHENWLRIVNTKFFRCDHNSFHDHKVEGAFLELRYTANNAEGEGPIVEYNQFADKESDGTNEEGKPDGGEAVRAGQSDNSKRFFRATFRYNYFTNCKGDGEIVTNKSCGNTYYHNSWIKNDGSLSLRHGSDTRVEANYFKASGLRIGGANNIIACNHFTENSNDDDARYPIVIMNGNCVTPPGQKGAGETHSFYELVKDNKIVLNTIENGTGTADQCVRWGWRDFSDNERKKPENNIFSGNIVKARNGTLFAFEAHNSASEAAGALGNTFSNNIFHATDNAGYGELNTSQATRINPGLTEGTDGVYRITNTSSTAFGKVSRDSTPFSAWVKEDIDGHEIIGRTDAGCDFFINTAPIKKAITPDDVGPEFFGTVIT
ncbi:MAG TPA: chondroitinase-B domain-containing protein [Nitrososphaera sp.]|nr:chondroitinase-B domain-containing protein [Nitrososphaera sp.]